MSSPRRLKDGHSIEEIDRAARFLLIMTLWFVSIRQL
jgi:hypothetical protein